MTEAAITVLIERGVQAPLPIQVPENASVARW